MNSREKPHSIHEGVTVDDWNLEPGRIYLNHGSFGPSPRPVRESQLEWMRQLEANPQRFLTRDREPLLHSAIQHLAEFVGAQPDHIIPVDNATFGMNLVANSLPLQANDEVLLTTHEYGAVKRLWQQRTRETQARMVQVPLPLPLRETTEIVESILQRVTDRTRLIVISHVTSPTALILPVAELCRAAHERGVPVCVDGPHAVGMLPLELDKLGCDFYTASCHKWLSAPFGTGFLYVSPEWQQRLRPCIISWGGSTCGWPASWKDEFLWLGTRDPSGFLAVPAAIDYLRAQGLAEFRLQTHRLVTETATRLLAEWGTLPYSSLTPEWVGSMVTIPLPDHVETPQSWTGHPHPLQTRLAEQYGIEVPVMKWGSRMHLRISCHLYNTQAHFHALCQALAEVI